MPRIRLPLAATNSWKNEGMQSSAVLPSVDGSVGTSRQPSTVRPSSPAMSSMRLRVLETCSSSPGMKAVPAAYECLAGSSKSTTSRKKRWGTCIRIPAPSPELGSAPAAPRCSRLRRAVKALLTMSWLGTPVRVPTNATPHASCSCAPSYSPWRGNACMCTLPSSVSALGSTQMSAAFVSMLVLGRHWPMRKTQRTAAFRGVRGAFQESDFPGSGVGSRDGWSLASRLASRCSDSSSSAGGGADSVGSADA